MIFEIVITVEYIIRVIKYRFSSWNLSSLLLSMLRTRVCVCTSLASLPLLCPRSSPRFVSLNSLTFSLEPVPFFLPLSFCLCFRASFSNQRRGSIEITFSNAFHGLNFAELSSSASELAFLFFGATDERRFD